MTQEKQRETVRTRALRCILQHGELTEPQVRRLIKLSHALKVTLDQEVERGHLVYASNEAGSTAYRITAKGRRSLKAGTVPLHRGRSKEPVDTEHEDTPNG